MTPTNVAEILDFAIEREQEAHDFYQSLAGQVQRPAMPETLRQFAQEELGHRKKLEAVKGGKLLLRRTHPVPDLRLADYLVDPPGALENLDLQQILIVAMKREKASFRLYTDLAGAVEAPELRETFLALALEEAKHKLRFEIEYDEMMLEEN